jgi:hypothetical protein
LAQADAGKDEKEPKVVFREPFADVSHSFISGRIGLLDNVLIWAIGLGHGIGLSGGHSQNLKQSDFPYFAAWFISASSLIPAHGKLPRLRFSPSNGI